jgi:WXG100 family type VII secretion target
MAVPLSSVQTRHGRRQKEQLAVPEFFSVDLPAFAGAIARVSRNRDSAKGHADRLKSIFVEVDACWDGPAGETFTTLRPEFNNALDELTLLLDDIVVKMQQTYDNYVAAEEDNASNFQ